MSMDFANPNAQPFMLEGGEDALLMIHGFTGSPGHMRYIGNAVHAAGFSVRGILLPGHGLSLEDMEKSNDRQWFDACCAAFIEMKQRYRHVSVAGLSMGGILALLLAEEFEPSTVILFAAAMKYKRATNRLSPLVKRVVKRTGGGGRKDSPDEFLYAYDFGYDRTPVAKVEDMTRLQSLARRGLGQVSCPVLAFQSHRDGSVHAGAPDMIMRGVSSQVKEISWVDRSSHVLTLGPERDYVAERVIDFLRRYGV